ncbi:MAG: alpha/beta fold hydrolase [Candidatus Moranbacteria bacterium]|nr:alpha/beta fold hydrolase [Candidatus Moranbacteria bacterium]
MKTIKRKINSPKGEIVIVIHSPKRESEKLAILCPGFLDSKDYKHLVYLADALCEKGYTAVRFDPSGTWESVGDISEYTTTQYLENIKTVLEYMLRKNDYKDILVGGHSRGGRMALLYAARDNRITKIIGIMASWGFLESKEREDWKMSGVKISSRDLPSSTRRKNKFYIPFSHILDLEKYDVIDDISKIKAPVVLIAGELDDVVSVEDVRKLYENANEPKSITIIPGIEHDYRRSEEEILIVNKAILEQLNLINKQYGKH